MKIYYANDTQFHAGTVALNEAIYATLRAQGHEIIATCVRPEGPNPVDLAKCDALVVNGEGTFRDETRNWEPGRQRRLMEGMATAKRLGLRVHFINGVWCNIDTDWWHILETLDEVAVREPISARMMKVTQGIEPDMYLDMSYYAPVADVSPAFNANGRAVLGRIYPHNFPDKLDETFPVFDYLRELSLPILDPGKGYSWSTIIKSLKGAVLYVTGQHHGVYAACKARVPFVYCKCNTHKVDGLFEWAGVDIPTVTSARDVHACGDWAFKNKAVYEKLFDFMEECKPWPGIP